jgi:hypothetical protein
LYSRDYRNARNDFLIATNFPRPFIGATSALAERNAEHGGRPYVAPFVPPITIGEQGSEVDCPGRREFPDVKPKGQKLNRRTHQAKDRSHALASHLLTGHLHYF